MHSLFCLVYNHFKLTPFELYIWGHTISYILKGFLASQMQKICKCKPQCDQTQYYQRDHSQTTFVSFRTFLTTYPRLTFVARNFFSLTNENFQNLPPTSSCQRSLWTTPKHTNFLSFISSRGTYVSSSWHSFMNFRSIIYLKKKSSSNSQKEGWRFENVHFTS